MSLKTHQLQAHFARRREMEHMRIERTEALNRYYDHWGKVNSRFESWSTPEYYQQAEDKFKQRSEKKEKERKLHDRQEKLRNLFAMEKSTYDEELRERGKPRSRKITASTETLKKVDENLKEREHIRKKLDLEAKLYGKWRHGVDDENVIFESKSDNEVLAKLNWLDKQIEDQLQREKDEALAQERNLRMQEELNKSEEVNKERQKIREQEIKEIRALQEKHMEQLQQRQRESEALKVEEKQLRLMIDELTKELELLTESSAMLLEPAELTQAYNLKKIKILIRKRSEEFRNQIKYSISILERMQIYAGKRETWDALLKKYREQLEAETYTISQIEAMYESEAKYNLQRCEEMWQSQHLERYQEMKKLLKDEQSLASSNLNENLQRQNELIEIRSTHIASIENSNDKLKQLIKEQQDSPRLAITPSSATTNTSSAAATYSRTSYSPRFPSDTTLNARRHRSDLLPVQVASQSSLPKVTNSFTNLNLDVWQDLPSARGGIDSPRLQSQRSMQVVTPDTAERPRFARKRVAWT